MPIRIYDQIGSSGASSTAGADGHLHAFASTAFAGATTGSAIVGRSLTITPGLGTLVPWWPSSFFPWLPPARLLTFSATCTVNSDSTAAGAFGGFTASAGIEMVLLRGNNLNPAALQSVQLENSIAPVFWAASHFGTSTVSLSVSAIHFETSPQMWSIGVRLWASSGGFGLGFADANIFTDVFAINNNIGIND